MGCMALLNKMVIILPINSPHDTARHWVGFGETASSEQDLHLEAASRYGLHGAAQLDGSGDSAGQRSLLV